jgi:NAD+ kinase
MSKLAFKKIGVIGKTSQSDVLKDTMIELIDFLCSQKIEVILNEESQSLLPVGKKITYQSKTEIGKMVDLVIVVGGDGSLLNAARHVIDYQVPVLGINRGRLGFLTDINPQEMEKKLLSILNGQFTSESRTVLRAQVLREGRALYHSAALNDVVLYSGNVARMIEFEIAVDHCFVARLRADGLITTTPTGSTAYALSAGGPILHPQLPSIALVPMHPHVLSARPLVVPDTVSIQLTVTPNNKHLPKMSCDGQMHFDMVLQDVIEITKYPTALTLLHPLDYEYYGILRDKLGWSHSR